MKNSGRNELGVKRVGDKVRLEIRGDDNALRVELSGEESLDLAAAVLAKGLVRKMDFEQVKGVLYHMLVK